MKQNLRLTLCGMLLLFFFCFPSFAHASDADNIALVMRGTAKTLGAALQVPANMMSDSTRVMFPFGLVTGAVKGTVKAVVGTVSGAYDIARGGAPYAKYLFLL